MDRGFSLMPPSAFKIYMVIKIHVNYVTGIAFPGIRTISERAGLSISQVQRGIKSLESAGYLIKNRDGRKNNYLILERTAIYDKSGLPTHIVSWVFKPANHAEVRIELKQLEQYGMHGEFRHLRIQEIQTAVRPESAPVMLDAQQIKRKLDASTSAMDQALARIYETIQAKENA